MLMRSGMRSARSAADPVSSAREAGNVNTEHSIRCPRSPASRAEHGGAWVHVDGAFGLWAAASSTTGTSSPAATRIPGRHDATNGSTCPTTAGLAVRSRSEATPCRDGPERRYLQRLGTDRTTTSGRLSSRARARGFSVYAACARGRAGIAALVERCCAHARLFAEIPLEGIRCVQVVNEVLLNQALVRFRRHPAPRSSRATGGPGRSQLVQRDGTCWSPVPSGAGAP